MPPPFSPSTSSLAATANFAAAGSIGTGGAGDVYVVTSLPSLPAGGGALAVKRITLAGAHGAAELDVLGRCRHPSLLPLLGYCLEAAPYCLVYPLCAGGNLEDRLLRHPDGRRRLAALGLPDPPPLTIAQRLRVALDAARALAYLHAPADGKPRTLHRDVKPSNILIGADGEGYLADVGLAKGAEETSGPAPSRMSTAAVKGTTGFLDPLFTLSGEQSEVTDAFGIGITLLMCLTGLPGLEIISTVQTIMRNPRDPKSGCHPRSPTPPLAIGRWRRQSASPRSL